MLTLLSFLLASNGFLLIALTQKQPRKLIFGGKETQRVIKIRYRLFGGSLILSSFLVVITAEGLSFGVIVWGTLISVSGLFVCLFITVIGAIVRVVIRE